MSEPSFKAFLRSEDGSNAMEFVLIVPILFIMFFGVMEISNYIYAHQKIQNANYNALNILGRNIGRLNRPIAQGARDIALDVIRPFDAGNYAMYITLIQRDHPSFYPDGVDDPEFHDVPYIVCQVDMGNRRSGNPSRFDYNKGGSKPSNEINATGDVDDDLQGAFLQRGEQLLAGEFAVRYEPMFSAASGIYQLLDIHFIYYFAVTRPRGGIFERCND